MIKEILGKIVTDFQKFLNFNFPQLIITLKMLIFVSKCTAWYATELSMHIERNLNFLNWNIKPEYMMKKSLGKMVTDFSRLLHLEILHSQILP